MLNLMSESYSFYLEASKETETSIWTNFERIYEMKILQLNFIHLNCFGVNLEVILGELKCREVQHFFIYDGLKNFQFLYHFLFFFLSVLIL